MDLSEIETARDFFFLGRGELFHAFISAADAYLSKPPSATTQHGTESHVFVVSNELKEQFPFRR